MGELGDRSADERLLRFIPVDDRLVQQDAGLMGEARENRRQVYDQLSEEIERDGTNVLQLTRAGRFLAEFPRLLYVLAIRNGRAAMAESLTK